MIKIYKESDVKELFKKLQIEYLTDYKYEYNDFVDLDMKSTEYFLDNRAEFDALVCSYSAIF